MQRAFPLGLAVSLAPNVSKKTFSTAFLISTGLAHRTSDNDFTPVIVAPRFAHPVTVLFEVMKDLTCSTI